MPKLGAKPLAAVPDPEPSDTEEEPETGEPVKVLEYDEFGFVALDDTEDTLNILYYGREGSGKSTNAAMAANHPGISRVLVINAESGLKKAALQRRGVDTSKVVLWPPPGRLLTFRSLEALHAKILSDLHTDPTSWGAVVLDSITEIHQALREQATEKRIDKVKRTGGQAAAVLDEDFVDRDDYGVMTNQMRKLIRRFRDLPCHVVVTALEKVSEDGMVGPAISPALATDVLGYMDLVLYCKATQHAPGEDADESVAEFRALTRPGSKTRAKDRFDLTPRALAEPFFTRVAGYITGGLDEETDPVQAAYRERREAEARAKAEAEAEKAERKAASKTTTRRTRGSKTAGSEEQADAKETGE